MKYCSIKYIQFIVLFFLNIALTASTSNLLLDQNFLQDTTKVQELLYQQGFKKVFFTTPDNIKLCGLFLDQSNKKTIQGSIIYCAGFYPGTKEGMTSFYTLLADQPYNFLVFDARGHHESEGQLFSYTNLKNYGSCEYQDVLAAIKFIDTYNAQHHISQNIFIHGICAGAFHSIKALNHLKKHNYPECQNIKGIIFDSGWLQVTDIVEPTICAEIHKRFENSWLSWLIQPLCYLALQWYRLTLKHHHYKIDGINDSIKSISCPIFFIHCIHDPYVPIKPVANFVQNLNSAHRWWIEYNSHANFHMKEPNLYMQKMLNFLKIT